MTNEKTTLDAQALGLATCPYSEMVGGLLVCGINWGGEPSEWVEEEKRSFFSDKLVNDYPFRNRIVGWFDVLGHPLEQERGKEGKFERSIAQTNWLLYQSRNTAGRDLSSEFLDKRNQFFDRLSVLEPCLIFFFSGTLLKALNNEKCIPRVEEILGERIDSNPQWEQKSIKWGGEELKRFNFGFQKFATCQIVSFPHPTPQGEHPHDEYIKAFRPEIEPLISAYKTESGIA